MFYQHPSPFQSTGVQVLLAFQRCKLLHEAHAPLEQLVRRHRLEHFQLYYGPRVQDAEVPVVNGEHGAEQGARFIHVAGTVLQVGQRVYDDDTVRHALLRPIERHLEAEPDQVDFTNRLLQTRPRDEQSCRLLRPLSPPSALSSSSFL